MTRKKILLFFVLGLTVSGLAVATLPLFWSLYPSTTAFNKLPHVNLNNIAAGTYKYVNAGIKSDYSLTWLVIKKHDNSVNVFTIPTYQQSIMLPDTAWYRFFGKCDDFRPVLENKLIKKDGFITCHDPFDKGWYKEEWKWTYDGNNLGSYTEDMMSTRHTIANNVLIIGKY